ncbi:heavy metal translocating P-type ATPase [Clostridium sp.]|uniref:heavy metal translocating P-type ATPase n=1 Tax=Clostridium sp. TaxID=1506 RepID=UPI002629092C|nr:heavy metal translocating P-type ATPase [Clostridium sp.]
MSNKDIKLVLSGLDCANCAGKIEKRVNEIEEVKEASLNFTTATLSIEVKDNNDNREVIINKAKDIIKKLEPDVKVYEKTKGAPKINNINTCSAVDGSCNIDSKIEEDGQSSVHEHHNHNKHEHDRSNKEEHEEHNHGHNHDHSKGINLKETLPLVIGALIYGLALLSEKGSILSIILFIISYVLIGGKVVITAVKNVIRGEVFDENFLMTIATLGAFFIGEYPEGVAVMLFYEVGELFQSYAVNKSRKSITSLMDIRADYANLIIDGKETKVDPNSVNIDDVIIIKPGEKVPLDGIIIEGETFIDTSALTGESVPRRIGINEEILAGCINTNGVIKVKVEKLFEDSTVSKILELVENASSKKAPTEKFITKFARVYTPIVVFSAVALAVIPPLVIKDAVFNEWLSRALIFLVVSCPCALVVSIPLGLFAGIGGASRKGILVKGGNYLEALKDADTVVFDKTGTLTKGIFKVTEINEVNIEKDKLIEIAAIAESLSNHPIAKSIIKEYGKEVDNTDIKEYKEVSGMGIQGTINDSKVLVGNYKLMENNNINYNKVDTIGTVVHIAINEEYKGNIVIADEIKEGAVETIKELKNLGVSNIVMLTGDNKAVAEKVGNIIGIDKIYSELLPADKVNKVEEIINEKTGKGKVLFVGDGINDAPVLARADIGVAMGGMGSDAAIEAADLVLMKDDPLSLVSAINIGRKTNKILWQNIVFSLGVKVLVLILGALGMANMWIAVFADVGVTIIAIINSSRCLK